MRTTFALTDDELFKSEGDVLSLATETTSADINMTAGNKPETITATPFVSKRYFTRSVIGVGGIITSLIAILVGTVAAAISTAMGYGNRATAGFTTLAILLTSIIGIGTANYLDTSECAFISSEASCHMGNIMVATIDSGATSSAIPSKYASLLKHVTVQHPNQQIKIASGKYLGRC